MNKKNIVIYILFFFISNCAYKDFKKAQLFEESGDYHSAAKYYQKVILRDKKNKKAYLGFADALYGSVVKKMNFTVFNETDWLNALAAIEIATRIEDKNTSVRNKNIGNIYKVLSSIYLQKDDLIKAGEYIEKTRTYLINEPDVYFNLGFIANKKNEIDSAILHYNKAIQLNPAFNEAKINLALILKKKGELDNAEKLLKDTVNSDTVTYTPEMYLADIYIQRGNAAAAEEILKNVKIEILRNNIVKSDYYNRLGIINLINNKSFEAFEYFKEAIKFNFWNYNARVNAAKIFYERGEYQTALLELESAAKHITDNSELLNFQGLCYIGINDYKKAEQALVNAFQKNSKSKDIINNLIYFYTFCIKDEIKSELYKMTLNDLDAIKNEGK